MTMQNEYYFISISDGHSNDYLYVAEKGRRTKVLGEAKPFSDIEDAVFEGKILGENIVLIHKWNPSMGIQTEIVRNINNTVTR